LTTKPRRGISRTKVSLCSSSADVERLGDGVDAQELAGLELAGDDLLAQIGRDRFRQLLLAQAPGWRVRFVFQRGCLMAAEAAACTAGSGLVVHARSSCG
jgi:hypothetical protein